MNDSEQVTAKELVRRFLDATSNLSDPEAARIVGVTHTTIGRWKIGWGKPKGWKKLQAGSRRKITEFLRTHGATNEGEREHTDSTDPNESADAHAGETWPDYLTEVLVRKARAAEKRADAALIWARWLEKEADGWAGAMPQPALTSSEEAAAKEEAKREEERRRNQAQPSAG